MEKTRAECSQNAYTSHASAFLSHWIQIFSKFFAQIWHKKKKKKKKNRPCFFAFYGRSGEGNITIFFFGLIVTNTFLNISEAKTNLYYFFVFHALFCDYFNTCLMYFCFCDYYYFIVFNLKLYWRSLNRQLRVRRALSIFKDVPLRTRRALSLYNVYMVIAPFQFSTEHLCCIMIAPFWLSTEENQYCSRRLTHPGVSGFDVPAQVDGPRAQVDVRQRHHHLSNHVIPGEPVKTHHQRSAESRPVEKTSNKDNEDFHNKLE